ncbi:MAG: oligoendopeptidase F, partial [Devosia sp.]|nr:oligoendopeptidase F [Devosia sp.]
MSATTQKGHNEFGNLPVWDLSDLYPGKDSPEFKTALTEAKALASKFEADYKGKLVELTKAGKLVQSIKDSEKLEDLGGRIGSFAFLQYAQNTTDPDRAKFMGDINEALTALSTQTLFYTLELNRIDDADLEAALSADPELARYRVWFAELRKAKPYQLDDKLEELFQDKSVTSFSAWSRLYDETLASLEFEVDGETLSIEATLHLLSDKDEKKRESAYHALAKVLKANSRLFTHITNVLAKDKEISDRWRGYEDIADSRHMANSIEREVVDALQTAVQEAYPRLSHRYYKMKAKWFGKDKLNAWDRNAPL